MEKFVLDTDICIYWLKGNENIEHKIIGKRLENVFITVITECELFYGAFKSTRKDKNLSVLVELKKKMRTLHTEEGVSHIYGRAKYDLESTGRMLDDADLLIAAIALSNNATLVTNNVGHFRRIHGLKIENWMGD